MCCVAKATAHHVGGKDEKEATVKWLAGENKRTLRNNHSSTTFLTKNLISRHVDPTPDVRGEQPEYKLQ
jgi:hypothetical protein